MGFCSCIPPPASVQPRKIYNVLVPDVFGNLGPPPKLGDALSSSTNRKIGKLQEYVQKNPSKAAKVSRRLTRRIKKALAEHALGDVKVAVHAYKHLLGESTAQDSSYTFSYFSKELVQQPDTVIHTLLTYNQDAIQSLGAQLLGSYIHAQSEIESQPEVDASLVEVACKIAASAAVKEHQRQKGGGGGGLAALDLKSLQVSCLGAMREYVVLCHKLRILPSLLEQIEVSVLEIIENDEHGKAWLLGQAEEKMKQPQPPTLLRAPSAGGSARISAPGSGNSFLNKLGSLRHHGKDHPSQRTSKEHDRPKGQHEGPGKGGGPPPYAGGKAQETQRPVDVALDVLSSYRPFLRDISTVRRVMETLLLWLNKNNRWDRRELVEGLLALVQSFAGDLTFPLTSCLLRHCASARSVCGLSPQQRATVVRLAAQQGLTYSLSALSLALSELPRALLLLPADTPPEAQARLEEGVHSAVRQLAVEVGDAEQVCEAVGLVLRGSNVLGQPRAAAGTASAAALEAGRLRLHTLQCGLTVVNAIPTFAGKGCAFSGSVLPPTLLRALADTCSSSASATAAAAAAASEPAQQQQLWQLQQQQGLATGKLLQGMLVPLADGGLRDERQALLLLQLAGQWLGLLGAPPLPGSTSPDNAAVLHGARTAPASNGSAPVDASDVHVEGLAGAGPIGGPAMVPPPPAFELAARLTGSALTCSRGPGPALGAARLALHAHAAALRAVPPFPQSLDQLLRASERSSSMSLLLPQPPAFGDVGTPQPKATSSIDEEPHTPQEEFGTPKSSNSMSSQSHTPGAEFQTPGADFGSLASAIKGRNGPLASQAQPPTDVREPSADAAISKWRAGLLVLGDVVVQQLAAHTRCSGLVACEVKEAHCLVPELQAVTTQPGSGPTLLQATAPSWASTNVAAQLEAVVAGLQKGGGQDSSSWAAKVAMALYESGSMLVEAFGAPGLLQQLRAPLERSSSCDADAVPSRRMPNGISRGGSGVAVDPSLGADARGGLYGNGGLPGRPVGSGHNLPVSTIVNILVAESDDEDMS